MPSETLDLFTHRMTQPYRGEPPHVKGSDTSLAAAEAIKPHRVTLRQRVYNFIEECGRWGAIQEEITKATGIKGDTLRPRMVELENEGKIEKTDDTRKTDSNRNAVVYRIRPTTEAQ